MAPRSEVQIQARYAILTPAKMTLQKDFHTSIQTQSRNRVSPLNSSNHNEISKLKKKLSRKLSEDKASFFIQCTKMQLIMFQNFNI